MTKVVSWYIDWNKINKLVFEHFYHETLKKLYNEFRKCFSRKFKLKFITFFTKQLICIFWKFPILLSVNTFPSWLSHVDSARRRAAVKRRATVKLSQKSKSFFARRRSQKVAFYRGLFLPGEKIANENPPNPAGQTGYVACVRLVLLPPEMRSSWFRLRVG